MNHETINALKFILALLIVGIFAGKFLGAYNTKIRNDAIDGCYNQSSYQQSYIENGKTIAIKETQKYLYDKCLLDKNIK